MALKSNHIENLWQELKRRKVVHVITVYAAVAFVILQLVDIVAEPLRLPVSTKALVIVLLCIGFIISICVSWIYDITPSGVKKTEPAGIVENSDQIVPVTSNKWKIATFICGTIIISLVTFNLINKRKLSGNFSNIEKSIAVLPFINDSPSDSNQYFINGIMDEILNNLQKIKDFRVVSRTSTAQYNGTERLTLPEIAKKLNVNFIVEGSGQKYGHKFVLRAQLIAANNERHLWAKSYEKEIQTTNDQLKIQSDIAQAIATELKATISPNEKLLIEKIPTSNLTAYDFYERGREEERNYSLYSPSTRHELDGAELMYRTALKYDSTYALSYTGLASVYWKKHFQDEYFSKSFLDSVLILCNIALKYDDQLEEAHSLKGFYFSVKGTKKQAIEEFDKALKVNPNYWVAYVGKGNLYFGDDYIRTIENLQKAASLNHGSELPDLFQQISSAYLEVGFIDKAKYYILEYLKLTGDSANYFRYLGTIERDQGNFAKALTFYLNVYRLDSTDVTNLFEGLARCYMLLGKQKESLKYHKIWFNRITSLGIIDYGGEDRIAYAYWVNGYKKEAEYYFDGQMNYCKRMIELKRSWGQELFAYYDLAGVYAFRDDKENAYKNLKIFNERQTIPYWMVTLIKVDPLFNSIRNEPEFQQIARDVEAKYQAEHERVRKWLEVNGMI